MRKLSIAFISLLLVAAFQTYATATPVSPPPVPAAAPASAVAPDSTSTGPTAPTSRADISTDYNPIVTHTNVREYKGWKTSERYEFSYIDGFQEIYNPEEPIVFSVEGKSDKLYVEEASGFSVFATMFDLSRNVGKRATVKYDPNKRTWQVKTIAPKDDTGEYKIVINLFCKKNDSPCATTYGFGTQIDKTLPLKVR